VRGETASLLIGEGLRVHTALSGNRHPGGSDEALGAESTASTWLLFFCSRAVQGLWHPPPVPIKMGMTDLADTHKKAPIPGVSLGNRDPCPPPCWSLVRSFLLKVAREQREFHQQMLRQFFYFSNSGLETLDFPQLCCYTQYSPQQRHSLGRLPNHHDGGTDLCSADHERDPCSRAG
jgi:hypothetical protein